MAEFGTLRVQQCGLVAPMAARPLVGGSRLWTGSRSAARASTATPATIIRRLGTQPPALTFVSIVLDVAEAGREVDQGEPVRWAVGRAHTATR